MCVTRISIPSLNMNTTCWSPLFYLSSGTDHRICIRFFFTVVVSLVFYFLNFDCHCVGSSASVFHIYYRTLFVKQQWTIRTENFTVSKNVVGSQFCSLVSCDFSTRFLPYLHPQLKWMYFEDVFVDCACSWSDLESAVIITAVTVQMVVLDRACCYCRSVRCINKCLSNLAFVSFIHPSLQCGNFIGVDCASVSPMTSCFMICSLKDSNCAKPIFNLA